jgi:hypothetical protein
LGLNLGFENMNMRKHRFLFLLFLAVAFQTFAQRGRYPGAGGVATPSSPTPSTTTDPSPEGEEDLDTVKTHFFYALQPTKKIPFKDTMLNNEFQHFTPMRARRDEYASLGLTGSPAKPIIWRTNFREGFDLGIHGFDIYHLDNQSIRYCQTSKAFSQAKWTLRSIGEDATFDFDYGSQFKNNNYLSLEWHKVNQSEKPTYNFGRESKASAINTNWAFGVAHLGKKYQYFASFSSNSYNQSHHGGVKNDTFLRGSQFLGNFNVPVRLPVAVFQNYKIQEIQWRHTYQLDAKKDSLDEVKRVFLLTHVFDFQVFSSKTYSNYNGKSDSITLQSFYKDFYTEPRGVRVFFNGKRIENSLSISTQKPRAGQVPDAIELGLKHRFYTYYFEPKDTSLNHIFAFGKWNFSLSKWLKINTYAHFGLLPDNAAEYCAKGDLILDLKGLGQLEAQFMQQRYQPSMLQTQMYNFKKSVWKNDDFDKLFSTTLSATYRLPKLNFAATGSYHLLNNYIYFDEKLLPIQTKTGVNILQLEILQDFNFKKIHFENYLAFQKSTNEAVHLPAIFGRHSVYLEGKIFRKKAMLARIGIDVRYTTAYQADAYHPLINQFYTQSQIDVPFFPAVDAYFSARVLKLKAFVKIENIGNLINKKESLYTVPYQPLYKNYIRVGFYRRFTD